MGLQTCTCFFLVCLNLALAMHGEGQIHQTPPKSKGRFWQQGRYVQGDMILTPEQQQKDAIIGNTYRWPNNVVPYVLAGNMNARERGIFDQAVADINAKTCITVRERNGESDYVRITNDPDGCFSYVGRLGGAQQLNLQVGNPGCLWDVGTPVHELMHAIGFFHEQSRPDRDDYVNIYWANIDPAMWSQFDKCTNQCTTQNLNYEYGSVMHYDEYAFSANGQMSMEAKDGSTLGNSVGLTNLDARKINTLYNC